MGDGRTSEAYPEPVASLLTMGEPTHSQDKWEDYPSLGFGVEHIPDLVRIVEDEALHTADSSSAAVWAPLHAWRTLGQLRAEEAVAPLLRLFDPADDTWDTWITEDVPRSLGLIGPPAIPVVAEYLADGTKGLWARVAASRSLAWIGMKHPGGRDACVAALTGLLEHFAEYDECLNGFLISALVDLNAVESAPAMEQAFEAGAVDLSIQGDWEAVQVDMGLLQKRITPVPRGGWFMPNLPEMDGLLEKAQPLTPGDKATKRNRKKRERQKLSRKKKRRK